MSSEDTARTPRTPSAAKTLLAVVCGAACALAIMMAVDPESFKNQAGWNRQRNHQELLALHAALALGISQQEVRVLLARPDFGHLKLFGADARSQEWWVYTPLEFGAQNWTLGLQFTDGRLSATRVRMADGDFHPVGAPLDQGSWRRLPTRSERAA